MSANMFFSLLSENLVYNFFGRLGENLVYTNVDKKMTEIYGVLNFHPTYDLIFGF